VGSSTLAIISSFRVKAVDVEAWLKTCVGTWEQGQNQESDERLVFSCDPVGVDGTKPDQAGAGWSVQSRNDWVFASPTMKGKQPLWPETLCDDTGDLQ
jgi:hypothetical protein